MNNFSSIVILTGAGISAESGISTFRDANGLWENHRIEDVASLEGFERNPTLVHNFYNARRQQLLIDEVTENAAHYALAILEQHFDGDVLLITQNVDDLHERGGSSNLLHMHGELLKSFCTQCHTNVEQRDDLTTESVCPSCKSTGTLRPDIVWFGEMPYHMQRIEQALAHCDCFVAIGTSGHVYPAAGFVQLAKMAGAHTIEINLEPSLVNSNFDESYIGLATKQVPLWVDSILNSKQ